MVPNGVGSLDYLGSPFPYWPFGAYKILSIPRGPKVLLTKSPIAIAPTNELKRAVSA